MLATVAAAYSTSTVRKMHSVFIYSEVEPHAMYAIYKQECPQMLGNSYWPGSSGSLLVSNPVRQQILVLMFDSFEFFWQNVSRRGAGWFEFEFEFCFSSHLCQLWLIRD